MIRHALRPALRTAAVLAVLALAGCAAYGPGYGYAPGYAWGYGPGYGFYDGFGFSGVFVRTERFRRERRIDRSFFARSLPRRFVRQPAARSVRIHRGFAALHGGFGRFGARVGRRR